MPRIENIFIDTCLVTNLRLANVIYKIVINRYLFIHTEIRNSDFRIAVFNLAIILNGDV